MAASCEHGNEPSVSVTGGEFIDKLSDHQLPKRDYAPSSSLKAKFKDILVPHVRTVEQN
jgi:hypothetical protein